MDYYIEQNNIQDYLILPQSFDWDIVEQELGFGKIFKIIPEAIYLELRDSSEDSAKEIFRLLTKAATHYSFVLSIPRLKVHIDNTGIGQVDQDKIKPAPWWDVRDLGLSLLKFADELFSSAISKLAKDEDYKTKIPFFATLSDVIETPEDFQQIYSINYSPEVYSLMQSFLKQAVLLNLNDKIGKECVDKIKDLPELYDFYKKANVFYALYYASLLPSFVYLQNAVVVQYEELPWQKSQVLTPDLKIQAGLNFQKLGDQFLKMITDYMKSHLEDFPCYKEPSSTHVQTSRSSGIYLV